MNNCVLACQFVRKGESSTDIFTDTLGRGEQAGVCCAIGSHTYAVRSIIVRAKPNPSLTRGEQYS